MLIVSFVAVVFFFVFDILSLAENMFKKVLVCLPSGSTQRLWTVRNNIIFLSDSSDKLGIPFSVLKSEIGFFPPHTCVCMHTPKLLHMHT